MPAELSLSELVDHLRMGDATQETYVDRTTGRLVIANETEGHPSGSARYERVQAFGNDEELALARRFCEQPFRKDVGDEAAQLMIFPVEIGLVDGERIDEMLDLAIQVVAQPQWRCWPRSAAPKRWRSSNAVRTDFAGRRFSNSRSA